MWVLFLVAPLHNGVEVGLKSTRDDEHGRPELIERREHLLGSLRLCHDAHFVFDRQNLLAIPARKIA
jgi:hypothetical protein